MKEVAKALMAASLFMSALSDMPYSNPGICDFKVGKSKHPHAVGYAKCKVCGTMDKTLYKTEDGYICKICKNKEGEITK